MNASPYYAKKRIDLAPNDWTAIVAPGACNFWSLKNADDAALTVRTDKDDASTEDTLAANGQELVTAPWNPRGRNARFAAGDILLWAKPASGTGPAVLTCVL